MSKLAIIGVVVAGLATSTTAAVAGHGAAKAHQRHARTVRSCVLTPLFPAGKNSTLCGPRVFRSGITVWYRDPTSGTTVPISGGKWRAEVPPYGP
jgi:hypothetical protein